MLNNSKAITTFVLVIIITSVITLLIIFLYSSTLIGESKYESSLMQCSILFNQINGKPNFFGNELNEPSEEFKTMLSKTCSSKEYKITKNSVVNAGQLVQDCWAKTGKGVDFFGANTNDLSICVYCGKVKTNDNINDFNTQFTNEINKEKYTSLFEETEMINSNENFLKNPSNLPTSIDRDNSIGVFYFAYRPKIECLGNDGLSFEACKEQLQITFSKFIGSFGNWFTTGAYLTSSGEEAYRPTAGILLGKIEENKENKFVENRVPISSDNSKSLECDLLIVPDENYD